MEKLDRQSKKDAGVVVCVLSHNGKDVSSKFLDCLVRQTDYDLYDLVWIDNGSTDGTRDLLEKHWEGTMNSTILFSKENHGVIGGRNIGFQHFIENTNSQYLIFLDNDQFVKDGWLEHHLAVLHRGYDVVGVEAWQLNRSFMPVQKNMKRTDWYSYVGCGGMLIRRDVVKSLGYFDERFNPCYFEDPDLCFRAYDEGFKIGWNFKSKIVHIGHQTLGKFENKSKHFTKSLMSFREKWNKKVPPMITMPHIPEFD